MFIECVKRDCPNVDAIFIDPIYCLVAGGLKEDVPASAFTKTMSVLQQETGAMLYYNHHTTKTQYNNKGDPIEKDDPFYGSQWLKAHVTGSFYLKERIGGVELICKKDNYGILPEKILLDYNKENYICNVPLVDMPALERVSLFIRNRQLDKKEFTFKDMEKFTELGTRRLRELLVHSSISDRIYVVSSIRNKNLYRVTSTPIE